MSTRLRRSRAMWAAALAVCGCAAAPSAGAGARAVRSTPPKSTSSLRAPSRAEASAMHYTVFRGDRRVLEFSPGPGALVSTAPPPPPGAPVPPPHPFLHGAALDATEEDTLDRLLAASTSVDDFVARLRAAGYRVQAEAE